MKVKDIRKLCDIFGEDITLGDLLKRYNRPYKCPQCKGTGALEKIRYGRHGYTPDETYYVECDLCKGHGYTNREYKPRMIQDGWE